MPYCVYNTINHELEHASQYEKASNRWIGNDNSEVLEQRLNDEHYYSYKGDKIDASTKVRTARFDQQTDFQLYRAQACEADARAAGLTAVEELEKNNRANGIRDEHAQDYIETAKADEVANNREMMLKLGMHSRENMAREELEHVPLKQVSAQERQKVLDYAREKDYEIAKTVLIDDSRGQATEQQLLQQFNENSGYKDFYQTAVYMSNKVNDSERKNYKYSKYKYDIEADLKEIKGTVAKEQSKNAITEKGEKSMSFYSNEQLTDEKMTQYSGSKCVGYGTGASHESIIQSAGGEIGLDGFKDPRPNQEGNIRAERMFINEKTNEIQGINFSKNGEFCCSYTGTGYDDIKDSNRMDCAQKQQQPQSEKNGYDDFKVNESQSDKNGIHW